MAHSSEWAFFALFDEDFHFIAEGLPLGLPKWYNSFKCEFLSKRQNGAEKPKAEGNG